MSPLDDERDAERDARREANRAGALWLKHELGHRQMTGRDLWQRMLHFGTVGYSTVTAYKRGDISITEKADLIARALGVDVTEIYDAAAGRDSEGLSRSQRLRRKAMLAEIDADTPDDVAAMLGRVHREFKRLAAQSHGREPPDDDDDDDDDEPSLSA